MATTSKASSERPQPRSLPRLGAVRRALRKPQFWFGFSVLLPSLVWYWLFSFQPILNAFRLATVQYKMLNPQASKFVGLGNFQLLFNNPLFLTSIRNTLTWTVVAFLILMPSSLAVAACLTNLRRGRNFYQTLIFIPVVVSLVAVSLLFRMLMDPEVGQFNQILRILHLPESRWLAGTDSALPTAVAIGSWKSLGFYVVILAAGMLGIPEELYDAALVDGANAWQRFRYVTLPLLAHTIMLVTVLMAIGSLQVFTLPYVLTGGGPGSATYVYNMLIYSEAFTDLRFGTATAAALLQFVFILIITLIQIKVLQPKWSY